MNELQSLKEEQNSTSVSYPLASILIVTRNRANSLERALKAVSQQDYPNYELLVIDNDSSDHTAEVVERYDATRIFCPSNYGIGYCRRIGVESARGEFIAFCDDDCVPRPDWLRQFVQRLQSDKGIALLGGHVINVGFRDNMQNKGRSRHWRNGKMIWVDDPREVEFYGNMNLAFRREYVRQVGSYDAFFNVMAELDLQARLRKSGFRVEWEPKAELEHHYTGINYKKRHATGGAQLVRIYFCMRHYRPGNFREWIDFSWYETQLFGEDLYRVIYSFGSSVLHLKFQRLPEVFKSLFQAVSARVAIPWLIRRANRSQLQSASKHLPDELAPSQDHNRNIIKQNIGEPLVSVIVVTRNRNQSLKRTLSALKKLTYPNYELIVVNNDSSDRTEDTIRSFGIEPIHCSSDLGIGACRQAGVNKAQGEIIAFCDDDCIPEPCWLESFVERLQLDQDLGVLGGRVINIGFAEEQQYKGTSRHLKNGKLVWVEDPRNAEFFGNMNLAMRKEAIRKIGGYDTFFNVLEEIDLQKRMRDAGYRVDYESRAVLRHYNTGTNLKKRHKNPGIQHIRIYFFLKHYRPQTVREWGSFFAFEFYLLANDVRKTFPKLGSLLLHSSSKRWSLATRDFKHTLSSRLAIPRLIWQTRRSKISQHTSKRSDSESLN